MKTNSLSAYINYMKRKKNYLNNKDLFNEVVKSLRQNKPTEKLEKMLILLVDRINKKFYYANKQDSEDCKQYAYYTIFLQWNKFNPRIGNNVFAYYSEIIKRAHAQQWSMLYKQKGLNDNKAKILSLDTNMDGEAMVF
jgi:hypothetical protein